uniref:Uncharacterized protein n=1 Tax=Alexandrium monilatum TaxID=311494 RepID=A0A7S4V2H3_9DINO
MASPSHATLDKGFASLAKAELPAQERRVLRRLAVEHALGPGECRNVDPLDFASEVSDMIHGVTGGKWQRVGMALAALHERLPVDFMRELRAAVGRRNARAHPLPEAWARRFVERLGDALGSPAESLGSAASDGGCVEATDLEGRVCRERCHDDAGGRAQQRGVDDDLGKARLFIDSGVRACPDENARRGPGWRVAVPGGRGHC